MSNEFVSALHNGKNLEALQNFLDNTNPITTYIYWIKYLRQDFQLITSIGLAVLYFFGSFVYAFLMFDRLITDLALKFLANNTAS